MHEDYYGFTEKPFSLTPDPKYLYKSESHANAFELLQYAIRRREGFVVVTGDIGTGKTTLCRAILEQLDRKTFTALVLNPFLSEEDLLRLILQDFGVVSRDEIKRGRLDRRQQAGADRDAQRVPAVAAAAARGRLLIIDEAQNLPLQVLEQIRILSNLETDKEKLLQIVLVGQPNLKDCCKTPELRQLDQRVSIRYELKPLTREETSAYVAHRLTVAGGGAAVRFAPKALDLVHRYTAGIPRLINLLCDRALLGGYSARTNRITPEIVGAAAIGSSSRCRGDRCSGGCAAARGVRRRRGADGRHVAGGRVYGDNGAVAQRAGRHDRSAPGPGPVRGADRTGGGDRTVAGFRTGPGRVLDHRAVRGHAVRGHAPRYDHAVRGRAVRGHAVFDARAGSVVAAVAGGRTSGRPTGRQVFGRRRIVPSGRRSGRAGRSVARARISRARGARRIGRPRHLASGVGRSVRRSRAGAAG